jgi:hypothetical protein
MQVVAYLPIYKVAFVENILNISSEDPHDLFCGLFVVPYLSIHFSKQPISVHPSVVLFPAPADH